MVVEEFLKQQNASRYTTPPTFRELETYVKGVLETNRSDLHLDTRTTPTFK